MKYIRKSFSLFWLIAVMLFGTVSASAASAKPETPVLSGTAAENRVTLNWNKVKKASGYQIFLYYKAYGKYKCVGRIKNRNITSFTLTGSEDKLYTYKIRSYLKQGNKTLYSPSSKALEIKTAPGKPVITRIRVREESGTLIKWKKIKTAEGYQIFRSESEDRGYKRINIVSGNTTFSYTDTGTVSGKTYYYRIRAYVRNQGNVVYSELSDPAEAVMRKTIMIGDSRTDMMKDVVENDNITWICEVGMGYKWLRDTALKTLQEQMKGNEDIFVWLGVNDVYNISNYISLLNEEIPKWKAQGADVYIVAVGQVTKDPYVTNEEIEDFNARMKKEVAVLVIALTVLGGLHILLKRLNPAFGAADLSQKDAGHGVLQSVVLAVVGGLQRAKPRNLNIKVHLFFDHRVSGSQRLYLSVGERSLV